MAQHLSQRSQTAHSRRRVCRTKDGTARHQNVRTGLHAERGRGVVHAAATPTTSSCVELAGALKNVAALCCGISDGCGMGDNTRALLITRALSEISRLAECMGGRKETLAGLAGMGDLIVTCTSMHSRNHRAGILIGQGKSAQEAMDEVGAVVGGNYAARSAHELAQRYGVEMPISTAVYEVLYEGKSAAPLIGVLMSRTPKKESDCSWL